MKYLSRLERHAIEWILKNDSLGISIKGNFVFLDNHYQNSKRLLKSTGLDHELITILENNSTMIIKRGVLIPSQEESIIQFEFEYDNIINEFVRLFIKEQVLW